jgi:hypothetical protein
MLLLPIDVSGVWHFSHSPLKVWIKQTSKVKVWLRQGSKVNREVRMVVFFIW